MEWVEREALKAEPLSRGLLDLIPHPSADLSPFRTTVFASDK